MKKLDTEEPTFMNTNNSKDNDEISDSGNESGSDDDADEPCVVCGDEETTSKNLLILCDGESCDIPVHLKCYGVEEVPPGDEKWYCHRCEDKIPVEETDMICCPFKGGAVKRTNFDKKYIHIPCAWWNPAVEGTQNGFRVEKWLLDKQSCYICDSNKGLTIRCKQPGCKQWFHVMCAIENETIKLAKLRDIKHNNLCLDHTVPAKTISKNVSKKSKDPIYQSDDSQGSGSESDVESTPSSNPKSKDVKETILKRPNNDNDNYPRKHMKHSSGLPPKPTSAPRASPGSRSPGPPGSALQWLLEKAKVIQEASSAIENMPTEYKRMLSKELPNGKDKSSRSSPLDSLLDQAFDTTNNTALEEKNREIQNLKLQLSQRPSVETMDHLHKELQELRAQNGKQNGTGDSQQYKIDRDNLLSIFSYLRLPSIAPPTEANLSQFLATLRSLLERTNPTPSATPTDMAPRLT